MENRFIIVVVFATVVQGFFAMSSVEGIEATSDIQVAHKKTHEEFTQAIKAIFDSIEGNSSSHDGGNQYLAHLLKGYSYYFAVLPSYSQDDAVQKKYVRYFKAYVVTLSKALHIAKSKKGTYLGTVTKINAIRTTIDVQPVLTAFLKLIGISSTVVRAQVIADLDVLYSNIFDAMISRTAVNFGLRDEIPSCFKAGATAGLQAIPDLLYRLLKQD